MNTRRNAGEEIGGVAAGVNQVPPQAPAAGMGMLVNPTGLIDGEAEQQGVASENPPSSTMASMLRDFMRVNPPVYIGSKIAENLEEEFRASMLHDSIDLSRLMVRVQQVEEDRKMKHTRQGTGQGKLRRIFQGRVVLNQG
ncbi:hypothetical protein EJD97_015396 [Solanum chilense]|uniref:Uncharacterized protein n=1 Tax=Solanum chilense TaxID=4083 RepID=A0A6N2C7G1_SOLCI|nr:hypothetical protein EJD97_015396 [Solanum chilense]